MLPSVKHFYQGFPPALCLVQAHASAGTIWRRLLHFAYTAPDQLGELRTTNVCQPSVSTIVRMSMQSPFFSYHRLDILRLLKTWSPPSLPRLDSSICSTPSPQRRRRTSPSIFAVLCATSSRLSTSMVSSVMSTLWTTLTTCRWIHHPRQRAIRFFEVHQDRYLDRSQLCYAVCESTSHPIRSSTDAR
jgi:hypothetical protein